MHQSTLRSILSGFTLMDQSAAMAYYPLAYSILSGTSATNNPNITTAQSFSMVGLNGSRLELNDDMTAKSGQKKKDEKYVLVVPMQDAIIKYSEECGTRGTEEIADIILNAYADNSIAGIVIKGDSGGGDVMAVERLSSVIKSRNKPVLEHVHGGCGSGKYWIASYCDEIHSNFSLSTIGSIGVYSTVMDMYAYYEANGLPVEMVYAEQSTEKNAWFREWRDSGKIDRIQADVNKACDLFIDVVSKNRGIAKDSEVFKGGSFETAEALSLNLIDGTLTFEETINRCFELAENYEPQTTKKEKMFGSNKNTKFAALIALSAMAVEERTQEAVNAANAELQAEGLDAVLISAGLGISTNADVEQLQRSASELEAANASVTALEATGVTTAAELAAANLTVSNIAANFEGGSVEGFNLETAVSTMVTEHKEMSGKLDKGAGSIKKEGSDGDGEAEPVNYLSASEQAEFDKVKGLI